MHGLREMFMKRHRLTIICFFVIILLVLGPLVPIGTMAGLQTQSRYKKNAACNADEKIQEILYKINETLVREYMEHLVLDIGPRVTGSDGCKEAATYIYDQFEQMGLQVRFQNWSVQVDKWDPIVIESQNVEATLEGSDPTYEETIIFNAHYDSVEESPGANDDGSGTVAVLTAAYVLSQYNFKRTLKFVTFSGEEQGLFGSEAYVRELYDQNTPVLVEFNADGIGRATTAEFARKMRLTVTEDTGWIIDILQNLTREYGLNFTIPTWQLNRFLPTGFSDFYHFMRRGYESICVWQADGDPNYHSPADNMSNVNLSYLVNMTRHVAAIMAILADKDVEVPQISIAHPKAGKLIRKDVIIRDIQSIVPVIFDKTTISANVRQGAYPIEKVEFYYGNRLLFTDTEEPYEYLLNQRSAGIHRIQAMVYDTAGNTAVDRMLIVFLNVKII
jgi:hypothetical protein